MWGRSSSQKAALPALATQGSLPRQWTRSLSGASDAEPGPQTAEETASQVQAAPPLEAAAAAAAAAAGVPADVALLLPSADGHAPGAAAVQEWEDEPTAFSEVESFVDAATFEEHGGKPRGAGADGAAPQGEPAPGMLPAPPGHQLMGMEAAEEPQGEEPPAELDLAELLRRSESGPVLGEEPAEAAAADAAQPVGAQLRQELEQEALVVLPPVEEEPLPPAAPPAHLPAHPVPHQPHRRRTSHAGGALPSTSRRRKSVPRLSAAADGTTATAAAAAGVEAQQEDIIAELEAQRARHNEQLRRESRVRAELEGMLTRIESHFKNEQAGRKRAEEQLAAAVAEAEGLRAQLDAERAQQAALLQQAAHERAAVEAQCASQCAALAAELEASRQELALHSEALTAEVNACRAGAEAAARELLELSGVGDSLRRLAEGLAAGVSPAGAGLADTAAVQPRLHFHRADLAAERSGLAAERSTGGIGRAADKQLPKGIKKTQAVPGAQLRQPGDTVTDVAAGASPTSTLPALRGAGTSRGLQRERSSGVAYTGTAGGRGEARGPARWRG